MAASPTAQSAAADFSRRLERIPHLLEGGFQDSRDLHLREAHLRADTGFTEVAVVAEGDNSALALGERSEAGSKEHAILSALEGHAAFGRFERNVVQRQGERNADRR